MKRAARHTPDGIDDRHEQEVEELLQLLDDLEVENLRLKVMLQESRIDLMQERLDALERRMTTSYITSPHGINGITVNTNKG